MDRQRTQICANANRIGAVSTIPPVNMDRIVSLEYFASADDVHIKLFLSPTTAALPAHGRWSMPGTDYDSAINVHICRDGVPGKSAAYENQVLLH